MQTALLLIAVAFTQPPESYSGMNPRRYSGVFFFVFDHILGGETP
jgi:hypothetical protein